MTHNKTDNFRMVSATIEATGESVPIEAIVDEKSHDKAEQAYRLAVRLSSEQPVVIVVREVQDVIMVHNISEMASGTVANFAKTVKELTLLDLLRGENGLHAVQEAVELMSHLTSISDLIFGNRQLPTSDEAVEDLAGKQWITASEAAVLREIISLKQLLESDKEQLEQQRQIQTGVASSQERLRKNIATLSVDGLKSNPVLLRYIENLGKEEEKYMESKALEDRLTVAIKEKTSLISKKSAAALSLMRERLLVN